ncbi:DUF3991 and toprim domain-containing protein [Ruminococcus flavefaciens]|uniref:DUF3991 and toprim domain-containing protein n=1 Tax=Ruminococcus flavefaciens TaxID=1265 RepID=UPI0026F02AB9|nr:DUF3991 and toprim domain-containing protein [Ruminococcus flavefaciens]
MPYIQFTEEQKQVANNVELAEFLRMRGETLERAGREYKLIYTDSGGKHDSITMSGNRWFDHKAQTGGGAIKFMQYFYGMNFVDAVQSLLGYSVEPQLHSPPHKAETAEKKQEFKLPEVNSDMHRVYAYLIKQRHISPEIITHFAKAHTLYEDKEHHNVVFVGLDEKRVPRQASKRSATTYGNSFRMTVGGSDTRYSFGHFGASNKLYVFEAPIDMLSFITLYPDNWQEHSYITLNGVYEHPLIGALETHENLRQIYFCTDNDEGGIDGYERLRDILLDKGYTDIHRCVPEYKDWNEQLKALSGEDVLPAVPHFRKNKYYEIAESLRELTFNPYGFMNELRKAYRNGDNTFMTELAITGSVFYLQQTAYNSDFKGLCAKLRKEYRAYTDKGRIEQKRRDMSNIFKAVESDFRQTARTREQSVQTAKLLYQLADSAIRVEVEECHIAHEQELNEEQEVETEAVLAFG